MGTFYRQLACLCGNREDVTVVFEQNFDEAHLTPALFTARGRHDYGREHYHYRMVRCRHCGQLFSTPILHADRLAALYRESPQAYTDEGNNIVRSYLRPLHKWLGSMPSRDRAIEIGCGHGAMLGALLNLGFTEVTGVEPSEDAVRQATDAVRPLIRREMFESARFSAASADLVCAFQVLDHFMDPASVLGDIWEVLKPGGICYVIVHNERALQVKLLGERSPIIDVSHIYYFNPTTLRSVFERANLEVLDVMNIWNAYSVRTWLRMLPLPGKDPLLRLLESSLLGRIRLSIPAGNIGLIARKRAVI